MRICGHCKEEFDPTVTKSGKKRTAHDARTIVYCDKSCAAKAGRLKNHPETMAQTWALDSANTLLRRAWA